MPDSLPAQKTHRAEIASSCGKLCSRDQHSLGQQMALNNYRLVNKRVTRGHGCWPLGAHHHVAELTHEHVNVNYPIAKSEH